LLLGLLLLCQDGILPTLLALLWLLAPLGKAPQRLYGQGLDDELPWRRRSLRASDSLGGHSVGHRSLTLLDDKPNVSRALASGQACGSAAVLNSLLL